MGAAEEFVVHCLILIVIVAITVLLYQVWKYLKSKPLGIQTVLDDLAKDGMMILALTMTFTWITWIKFADQYNFHVALAILKVEAFFRVSLVTQALTFSITRYLFVFNFNYINNVAEEKIKMVSRICVTVLAIACATLDDWTAAKKVVYLITENQINKEQQLKGPRPLLSTIISIASVLMMVYVQLRISYKRWKYPEFQNNEADSDTYNLKMISIVVGISLIIIVIVISSVYAKSIVLTSLITLLCVRIIAFVTILLLIYSNDRMFVFIKTHLLKCHTAPDLNVSQVNPLPDQGPDQVQIHPQQDQLILNQIPVSNPQTIHNNLNLNYSFSNVGMSRQQPSSLPDVCI